jgi:hypothetical protein
MRATLLVTDAIAEMTYSQTGSATSLSPMDFDVSANATRGRQRKGKETTHVSWPRRSPRDAYV